MQGFPPAWIRRRVLRLKWVKSQRHIAVKKLQVCSGILGCSSKIASLEVCLALALVPKQQAEQLKVQTAVLHGLAEVVLGLTLVPEPVGRS